MLQFYYSKRVTTRKEKSNPSSENGVRVVSANAEINLLPPGLWRGGRSYPRQSLRASGVISYSGAAVLSWLAGLTGTGTYDHLCWSITGRE
ncbi:hypothetical protein J6590_044717 [Homalodisca vitripennis]|nr:hypothetical protein J6590_044717 [Homalodisca vitripennis]